ncbi:MAG: AraC family transcriptional regulator [Clostridiales bacterium GWF2_36_10]|nr:MAG: AraC family transcriptional regulator [Clostridiales bacterium GWF2_36_10]HAN20785.1 AraC family transcriptional regulator [Clostridiales bacterium]
MDWLNCLNAALNYIEEHLDDEIDLERTAQIACCSTFHFQRMFSYIADLPLSEYIRRRRMTKAAVDLQNSNDKIIDIALKYGYDSPTAFNRAFHNIHGIAPSVARTEGIILKAFPPISFKITIKGEVEMNYRIEKKDAFKIVGVKQHYSASVEECFESVPKFWQETIQSGIIPSLCSLMDKKPFGILGVSTCMNSNNFDYYIAVATNKETPNDLVEYTIPECSWAIFECIGAMPNAIQTLQKLIVTEWLPTCGYEYANAPDIEVYFEGDQKADDYKCEVWLPVVKK